MSDLYARRYSEAHGWTFRCRAVAGLALLGLSGAWYIVRPHVTVVMAQSSLGCDGRATLIGAVLCDRYPQYSPLTPRPQIAYVPTVDSRARPTRFAQWLTEVDPEREGEWLSVVVDGDFQYITSLRCQAPHAFFLLHDWDGDDQPELWIAWFRPDLVAMCHAIIRVSDGRNDLVGLVLIAPPQGAGLSSLPFAAWDSVDGADQAHFVVEMWTPTGPNPLTRTWTFSKTLALMRWTAPSGVLVPELLPDDQSVLVWTPPDGKPYVLPSDRTLDEMSLELLPVPPGFGQTPTSTPATQPATQAATQPAAP